jgi:hypothetical protein
MKLALTLLAIAVMVDTSSLRVETSSFLPGRSFRAG